MKAPTAAVTAVVWIASLAGTYWFAQAQGVQKGAAAQKLADLSSTDSADTAARKTRPPGAGSGPAGADGKPPAPLPEASLNLKQLMTKLREAMRGGMNNPSGIFKALRYVALIRDEDLQEAIALSEDLKEPQAKMMLSMMLLSRWGEKDGPAAMAYAEKKLANAGPMMQMARGGILAGWAEKDPEAVWNYMKSKTDDVGGVFGMRGMGMQTLFQSFAAKDLDGAFKRFGELETPEEKRSALEGIFGTAYDDDSRNKLFARIDQLTDPEDRESARSTLVRNWTMADPDAAVAYIEKQTGEVKAKLVPQAAMTIGMSDPRRGAELYVNNAEPGKKKEAYQMAVSSWASTDPNAAGKWLGEQPQTPELDGARSNFASTVAGRDPESAMEWAKTITDEGSRTAAVENVYRTWAKKDQNAASTALNDAGLSQENTERIRKSIVAPAARPGVIDTFKAPEATRQ